MANVFIKPETIVRMGLGMLQRELILPRLVTRFASSDFIGKKDDTINIHIPAILAAREYAFRNNRASEIVLDELTELSIPVQLNKQTYSAVAVTDEQLTLDIADFGLQVLQPQVRAVAEKLEGYIATAMDAGTYAEEITVDETDDFFDDLLIEARRILNVANVPAAGRAVVLGANVEAWALKNELFKRADQSGSDNVLREAVIGRAAGFTIVGNVNSLDADAAYAFHPTAFGFANVSPQVPAGVAFGSGQTYQGLAMRWIRDYDSMHLQDRSVVSSFAGAVSVEDGRDVNGALTGENVRAVKINFSGAS